MSLGPTDLLAWFTVAVFLLSVVVERWDRDVARPLGAIGWGLFGVFWLALIPHFAFEQMSIIEAVLSAVAVPASWYTGYLLVRGRRSLFVLTRSVAIMGAIYLPFSTLPWLAGPLIETTTSQIEWVIYQLGYAPAVVTGDEGFRNTFVFETAGHTYRTHIVFACTGLGSMVIVVGLVAAVNASLRRKARAIAIAVPVIWALNIVRNVFIALAQGNQWFGGIAEDLIFLLFATSDPHLVSFLWADRVIAQSLSVVAMLAITWAVLREVPELSRVLEDVIYVATGTEYDLQRRFGIGARTDGGD